MPNPWDARPISPRGDFDAKLLFQTIGQALTEWAHVESAWAEVFAIFVSAPKRNLFRAPAVRAYGSITGFTQQCQLMREAGAAYFYKNRKSAAKESRFDELIKLSLNYAPRRNEIAHGQVSEVYLSKYKNGKGMKNIGLYLLPLLHNPKKAPLEKEVTYQYTSSDLIYYRQEFTKLYLKVSVFSRDLAS